MFGYIYVITNLTNNKKYVGKKKIVKNHENYFGSSKYLKEDIAKLGKNNFKKEIIEYCLDAKELELREIYYQKLWNVRESKDWYNLHIQNENFDTTGRKYNLRKHIKKKLWPESRRKKYSERLKANNINNFPGVREERSKRLKTGYNPFKDPEIAHKIWLIKHYKPFKIKTPAGIIVVVDNKADFKRKFGFEFNNALIKNGKIKQGKNKGYEYLGKV
jgi:hypothetical protein